MMPLFGGFYNLPHLFLHLYCRPQDHYLSLLLTCGGHKVNDRGLEKIVSNYKISRSLVAGTCCKCEFVEYANFAKNKRTSKIFPIKYILRKK
jgi:hypothetical protein